MRVLDQRSSPLHRPTFSNLHKRSLITSKFTQHRTQHLVLAKRNASTMDTLDTVLESPDLQAELVDEAISWASQHGLVRR